MDSARPRRTLTLMLLLAAASCGGEEPAPAPQANTCGTAGALAGTQCTGLAQCGGPGNYKKVEFCEHCFARPDTSVCEAGACRTLDPSGFISTRFAIPRSAAGAKSYTIASVNPVMADGTRTGCAELMSTCAYKNNAAINTGNSTFKTLSPPGDPDLAYPGNISADVGADRMLVIRVTTELQGKGTVVAQGCTGGIEVRSGQTTTVDLTLAAP